MNFDCMAGVGPMDLNPFVSLIVSASSLPG